MIDFLSYKQIIKTIVVVECIFNVENQLKIFRRQNVVKNANRRRIVKFYLKDFAIYIDVIFFVTIDRVHIQICIDDVKFIIFRNHL